MDADAPRKIAAVTDDGTTVGAHFGRARAYLVCAVSEGRIVSEELRDKPAPHGTGAHRHGHDGHREEGRGEEGHGHGPGASARHAAMVAPIRDCHVVLARGMGRGAHAALREAGLTVILTDESSIADAVRAYLDGTLEHRPERLH